MKMNGKILDNSVIFFKRRVAELTGIVLVIISGGFIFSLSRYNPDSPSFILNSEQLNFKDYFGSLSNAISDIFLQSFGLISFFIGISILNGIFIFCIANLLTKNSWPTGITEQQKHISKLRGVKISCLVWLLASIYLMISLWLSASALKDFQLLSQSIYMMVILLIGTRFFELPRKSDLM